ncbi:division/cell wall cluster transcriptional repressor MraZ [Qipengyuania flava]|nr:division/cell wall cluster transcriptional repressor MraZ [Qipengyuania flava]MBY5964880.1 division/cell wall cluster transcriptional repressor MraZ [Qipengyuania flava]MBY6011204.1 division/cell wall cluster transcriptional repressor MraZ [Qipengyuania flava]MBY6025646.1 division/cell wall cluster transcriptional repressor MraZ [Qipengyuania flava]
MRGSGQVSFGGYSGQAYSPAGDKGRFVLPPLFRKAVKESSDGRVLCLSKHTSWNCLVGFGLSRKPELEAQLDREEELAVRLGKEFDRDTRSSQLFGFQEMPFDDSGRFVMPDHLRLLGKIEDGLYFQGGGRFFTLWNPAELAQMGDDWAGAKAACDSFLADAKARGK